MPALRGTLYSVWGETLEKRRGRGGDLEGAWTSREVRSWLETASRAGEASGRLSLPAPVSHIFRLAQVMSKRKRAAVFMPVRPAQKRRQSRSPIDVRSELGSPSRRWKCCGTRPEPFQMRFLHIVISPAVGAGVPAGLIPGG